MTEKQEQRELVKNYAKQLYLQKKPDGKSKYSLSEMNAF